MACLSREIFRIGTLAIATCVMVVPGAVEVYSAGNPEVTAYQPGTVNGGETIQIKGKNFGENQGARILKLGQAQTALGAIPNQFIQGWNKKKITLTLPPIPQGTYWIAVYEGANSTSNFKETLHSTGAGMPDPSELELIVDDLPASDPVYKGWPWPVILPGDKSPSTTHIVNPARLKPRSANLVVDSVIVSPVKAGKIEAGKFVSLSIHVKNTGTAKSGNLTKLSIKCKVLSGGPCPVPGTKIPLPSIEPGASFPPSYAGTIAASTGKYELTVSPEPVLRGSGKTVMITVAPKLTLQKIPSEKILKRLPLERR